MPEDSFNQNSWPDKGTSGGSTPNVPEGEFPLTTPGLPKMPPVEMRTLDSDIASVRESGGGAPKPYTPPPPPQKEVFTPPEVPAPEPAMMPEAESPKESKKGLFLTLFVIIVVIGLGAVGYFLVYPLLFSAAPAPVATEAPTSPSLPQAPEIPTVPEVPTAPSDVGVSHTSFFRTAPDSSIDITASDISSYKASFEFLTASTPIFLEAVLKNQNGNLTVFGDFADFIDRGVLGADSDPLSNQFEPDFTLFTYTDSKGTWPGYIARLKSGAVQPEVENRFRQSEANTNFTNLFVVDPGAPSTWKSGTVSGVANRYLSFSQAGASLNYGWQGNLLVVGTSFPGFQEALRRLQ